MSVSMIMIMIMNIIIIISSSMMMMIIMIMIIIRTHSFTATSYSLSHLFTCIYCVQNVGFYLPNWYKWRSLLSMNPQAHTKGTIFSYMDIILHQPPTVVTSSD